MRNKLTRLLLSVALASSAMAIAPTASADDVKMVGVITKIQMAADGKSAAIPFGGKPEGASATTYAEFSLNHSDRNGREFAYILRYQ